MKILILGANGFIGSNLSEAILRAEPEIEIDAMDLAQDKLGNCLGHKRFHFYQGDMTKDSAWISEHMQEADVVLPLAAIATPATYVQNPLRVFRLDFLENLKIVDQCVQLKKRVIFPSTSEVYGMCPDAEFDEETSHLVTGPINKERWIYSTSKQMLDRVIYAYGIHENLSYTLFRPFNWYGPGLDNILNPKPGGSRVLTQFIGNIMRGENIMLVNGGAQKRCFAYIEDCVAALIKMIKNEKGVATNKIINIGNPTENISIRHLAEVLIKIIKTYPEYAKAAEKTQLVDVDGGEYFGSAGYQDVQSRVPSIKRAKAFLNWEPTTDLETGLRKTLDFYLKAKQHCNS